MTKPFYPCGRYYGEITHQKLAETKTGNPQLVVSFLVKGGINPADPDGDLIAVAASYERTVFRVITDKTLQYAMEDLDALKWPGENWAQFDENASDCLDIRGQGAVFQCNHEPHYQTGELQERWSVGRNSTGPPVKPLDEKGARKLDALFGKALKGRKKSEYSEPVNPPLTRENIPAETAKVGDDSVPF